MRNKVLVLNDEKKSKKSTKTWILHQLKTCEGCQNKIYILHKILSVISVKAYSGITLKYWIRTEGIVIKTQLFHM